MAGHFVKLLSLFIGDFLKSKMFKALCKFRIGLSNVHHEILLMPYQFSDCRWTIRAADSRLPAYSAP